MRAKDAPLKGEAKASPAPGRSGRRTPAETAAPTTLEAAIGIEVRRARLDNGLTVAALARLSRISVGMLSKIETGSTSPSLATLRALAEALGTPVTSLFRAWETRKVAHFVPAGGGLRIGRSGSRAGHIYELLAQRSDGVVILEPYLVTFTDAAQPMPTMRHDGAEFVYLLEGELAYRAGDEVFHLHPGDSLYFDGAILHGPERMIRLPARLLVVIGQPKAGEDA